MELDPAASERVVARARLALAEAALAGGDNGAAVAAAGAVLDADPYDEAARRALMRARTAAGRPGSALAAYIRVRERLAEDLGVPPTEETEALHDAIVVGHLGPGGAVPPAPPELVGRDAELRSSTPPSGRCHRVSVLRCHRGRARHRQERAARRDGDPGRG